MACAPVDSLLSYFTYPWYQPKNPSPGTWKWNETDLDPDSNHAYSKVRDAGGRFLYLNSSEQQQSSEQQKHTICTITYNNINILLWTSLSLDALTWWVTHFCLSNSSSSLSLNMDEISLRFKQVLTCSYANHVAQLCFHSLYSLN